MTQASWPGGISYAVSASISSVRPSSIATCSVPLTTIPRWWYWHDDVPAIGLTSVDHRQPGWNTVRPTTTSSSSKISTRPFGNVRVSSGLLKLLRCRRAMASFGERGRGDSAPVRAGPHLPAARLRVVGPEIRLLARDEPEWDAATRRPAAGRGRDRRLASLVVLDPTRRVGREERLGRVDPERPGEEIPLAHRAAEAEQPL